MQEQMITPGGSLESLLPDERTRIVNLCAYLTGSWEAAEDLAQDTLTEAWRNRAKLVDLQGSSRWLSAVARNVCLRWLREQGRQSRYLSDPEQTGYPRDPDTIPAGSLNLEIELERDELAGLLDRALAQLPADTRQALIHRYVLEMPQAEIAARLGLSEGAVEARLHRGKLSLNRLFHTDLRAEADAYGVLGSPADRWLETRMWCPICGAHKLFGQLPGAGQDFELHCPHCSWRSDSFLAQTGMLPDFEGVKGYRATLRRFMSFMNRYLQPGLAGEPIACRNCGTPLPLEMELPPHAHSYPGLGRRGVNLHCPTCGSSSYSDIYGIALSTQAGQEFWRKNPRIWIQPEWELEAHGIPALALRFQSRSGSAFLDVILSRGRYQVLETHANG